MQLSLDNNALQAVVTDVIFKQIPQEQRDEILRKAIVDAMAPKERRGGYGPPPKSTLEEAFEQAVNTCVFDAVKAAVQSDPAIQEKIRAACVEATAKFLDVSDMATLICDGMTKAFEARYR